MVLDRFEDVLLGLDFRVEGSVEVAFAVVCEEEAGHAAVEAIERITNQILQRK